jgi:hypothetical protein
LYAVPFDPVTLTDAVLAVVTVRVSDWPDEMVLELAVIVTAGRLPVETVMVVVADALVPDEPVAFAVYVVVEDGETVIVPPVAANVYAEPSEPETLTDVAFEAVTVKLSDVPGVIELFAALIETVGAGVPELTVIVVCALALPLEFVAVAV